MNINEHNYVATTASIIGNVKLGIGCSVWEHAVIRGDLNSIEIGDGSNIQDCCIIHASPECGVSIGKNVSVGHAAIVHGAKVEDDCIIGMNATVLDGAHIECGCIIAANAVVTPNMHVPKHSLVAGIPGKKIRQDENMMGTIKQNAIIYKQLAEQYIAGKFLQTEKEKR